MGFSLYKYRTKNGTGHRLLLRFRRVLQHRVQPTKHRHGKDDIAIHSADIEVTEYIVCDSPYSL